MKRTKPEAGTERRILTGMIVSDSFLRQVQKFWKPDCLTQYVRTVGEWCIKYYKTHEKAPNTDIKDLFDRAVRKGMDETRQEMIENFLSSISHEYESGNFNAELILEDAVEYFERKNLENLAKDVIAELDDNNVKSASNIWKEYKPVELPRTTGTDLLLDEDLLWRTYNNTFEPLFEFPGELGRFINLSLVRKGFLCFQGSDKKGKSWWLSYSMLQAAIHMNNVAMFTLADLSEEEQRERNIMQMAHRPIFENECEERWVPVADCENNQNDSCAMAGRMCRKGCLDSEGNKMDADYCGDYIPCTYCRDLYPKKWKPCIWYEFKEKPEHVDITEARQISRTIHNHMGGKSIKIVEAPSDTVSPVDIEHQLMDWKEDEDWIPDVLIIDYADACAPDDTKTDRRGQVNSIWKGLNRIRQGWNLLLLTATHTNRVGYSSERLSMGAESESREKNAHVTGMIGINQTEDEEELMIQRLNWVNRRKGRANTKHCVTILQDIAGGYVCMDSF